MENIILASNGFNHTISITCSNGKKVFLGSCTWVGDPHTDVVFRDGEYFVVSSDPRTGEKLSERRLQPTDIMQESTENYWTGEALPLFFHLRNYRINQAWKESRKAMAEKWEEFKKGWGEMVNPYEARVSFEEAWEKTFRKIHGL
jgi:hypothetical protein